MVGLLGCGVGHMVINIGCVSFFVWLRMRYRYIADIIAKEVHDVSRIQRKCRVSSIFDDRMLMIDREEEVTILVDLLQFKRCRWCCPQQRG